MNDVNAGYYPAKYKENRNAGLTTRAHNKKKNRIKSGVKDIRIEPGYNLWKRTKVGLMGMSK